MTAATITAQFEVKGSAEFVDNVKKADKAVGGVGKSAGNALQPLKDLNRAFLGFGTAILAGGAALVGFGLVASTKTALQMENLRLGMTAVIGSAAEANAEIKRLEQSAKLPGVDYQEAIRTSMALQAIGISAKTARTLIEQVGNALTLTGGSKALQENVMRQFVQMIGKGKVMEEELRIIAGDMPILKRAMKEAFGTADTAIISAKYSASDFLTLLSAGLGRLPRAAQGGQNAIDNMTESWDKLKAAVGKPIVDALSPIMTKLSETLEGIASSPAMREFAATFADRLPKTLLAIVDTFQTVRKVALVAAGAFALVVAGNVITGVVKLVGAFIAIANAAKVTAVAMMAAAAAFNPKTLAIGAAAALGVGVALGAISAMIDKTGRDQFQDLQDRLRGMIGPGETPAETIANKVSGKPGGKSAAFLDALIATTQGVVGQMSVSGASGGGGNPGLGYQQQTAHNTGRMAGNMDGLSRLLKSYAIGGGEIAGIASSPVELRAQRPSIQIKGGSALEQGIGEVAMEAVRQLIQQGYLKRAR